jgi:hypothetical protein
MPVPRIIWLRQASVQAAFTGVYTSATQGPGLAAGPERHHERQPGLRKLIAEPANNVNQGAK